jgi:hypothetical protein
LTADSPALLVEEGEDLGVDPVHAQLDREAVTEVDAGEAQQDGIRAHEGQVRHPQASDHQEPDQQQVEADGTEVAVECGVAEQCPHPTRKIDRREVAPEELETAVSRDLLVREADPGHYP